MDIPKTTLWIPPEILQELMYYVKVVDTEIGGLGLLGFDEKNNDIFIKELYLVEQTAHQTETDLLSKGIDQLYQDFIAKGEDEKVGLTNLWWHSHVDMPSSFSTTDDETMRTWNGKYLISLVINKRSEMKAMLMSKVPVLVCGNIDVKIDWLNVKNADKLEAEVKEKIKETPKKELVAYKGTMIQKDSLFSWYGKQKSLHDMTDTEWKKAETDLDDEFEEMSDDETMALRKMWGTGWDDYV
jgi:hypothetical protein